MTWQDLISKKLCPNCARSIIRIEQDIDGEKSIINFIHKDFEDFCTDIIEPSYYTDEKNRNYFTYIIELCKVLM